MNTTNVKQRSIDSVMIPFKYATLPINIMRPTIIDSIPSQEHHNNSHRASSRMKFYKFPGIFIQKKPAAIPLPLKCRFCLEQDLPQNLISACNCQGSIKYVHSDCLKKWLITRKQSPFDSKCEICNFQFNIEMNKVVRFNKEKCKRFFKRKSYLIVLIFLGLLGSAITIDVLAIQRSSTKTKALVSFILYSMVAMIYLLFLAKLHTDFKKECYDDIVLGWQVLDVAVEGKGTQVKASDNTRTQSKISINNYVKEANSSNNIHIVDNVRQGNRV